MFDGLEVEPSLLTEESDELEATLCMNDLTQGGVDRGSQCASPKDLGCLTSDISIHVNGCLGHTSMISGEAVG